MSDTYEEIRKFAEEHFTPEDFEGFDKHLEEMRHGKDNRIAALEAELQRAREILKDVLERYLLDSNHCYDAKATPPESCATCIHNRWDACAESHAAKFGDTPCKKAMADRIRAVLKERE